MANNTIINTNSNDSNANSDNLTAFLLHHYNSTESGDAALYTWFHDSGPTPVLILPALALSLIGLVGIPLNAGLVYTTLRHRKILNRNTNYLIAINAFFDMLQLTHPFPFLFIALSGTNFVGTFFSYQLITVSIFGIQCSLTCITCIGVDRLLSVLFPIRYHNMSRSTQKIYCGVHTFICVLDGFWNGYGLWVKCGAEPDKPVTGFIAQIGWDSTKDFLHYLVGPVLIYGTVACYVGIGATLLIRKKLAKNNQDASNGLAQQQKLLKSLTVIVCVHVGTALFGSLLLGFAYLYSTITTWYLTNLALCLILMGACSNAVVLYANSDEYRQLFKSSFGEVRTAIGVTQIHTTVSITNVRPLPPVRSY